MTSQISFEREGHILILTLSRPEAMNALTAEMLSALLTGLEDAALTPEVRAVVLTGSGRAFCVGPDHAYLQDVMKLPPAAIRSGYKSPRRVIEAIRRMEKPVIAAINGTCVSGGLEIAMAADLRIVSKSAKLGFPDTKLGLIPAIGGAAMLSRLIGTERAKLMILGAELVDGPAAAQWGLALECVEDGAVLTRAKQLATLLASRAPVSVGLAKASINLVEDAEMAPMVALSAFGATISQQTDDHKEGMAAFREKRLPTFNGK